MIQYELRVLVTASAQIVQDDKWCDRRSLNLTSTTKAVSKLTGRLISFQVTIALPKAQDVISLLVTCS